MWQIASGLACREQSHGESSESWDDSAGLNGETQTLWSSAWPRPNLAGRRSDLRRRRSRSDSPAASSSGVGARLRADQYSSATISLGRTLGLGQRWPGGCRPWPSSSFSPSSPISVNACLSVVSFDRSHSQASSRSGLPNVLRNRSAELGRLVAGADALRAADLAGPRAGGIAVELGRHAEHLALGVEQRLGRQAADDRPGEVRLVVARSSRSARPKADTCGCS